MQRIIIIPDQSIRNIVLAQPLAQALRIQYPESTIDCLVTQELAPLVTRMSDINQAIIHPFPLSKRIHWRHTRITANLIKGKYDISIISSSSWQSALIPFIAKIPIRRGWFHNRYLLLTEHYCNKSSSHEKNKLLSKTVQLAYPPSRQMITPKPLPPELSINFTNATHLKESYRINLTYPLLTLCPGSSQKSKRWPVEYFINTARMALQQSWHVLFIAHPSEKDLSHKIQQDLKKRFPDSCHNSIGQTNITDILDFFHLSSVIVTNDNGLTLLAESINRPVITIFGSSDYRINPPLKPYSSILHTGIGCSPCLKAECKYNHYNCLTEITPEQCLDTIIQLHQKQESEKELIVKS